MDKFGHSSYYFDDPSQKTRADLDVYVRKDYNGPRRLQCWLYKAKEAGKVSRWFGKWNKRYLVLDLDDLKMFYSSKPGGSDPKYLLLNVNLGDGNLIL